MNTSTTVSLPPLPPPEFRKLVGPIEEKYWRNESHSLFLEDFPLFKSHTEMRSIHERVFDFGCGPGRLAIQMLTARERPKRYLGIDVSRKLIDWCRENLTVYDHSFEFQHHDVYSPVYAPDNSQNKILPIQADDDSFSLAIAHSVFTHLFENQTRHYLREFTRIIEPNGIFYSTWFFFNREAFHVLAPHQNCLYVSEADPSQAVFYDWKFFRELVRSVGLKIVWVDWTRASGFHSRVYLHKGTNYPDVGDRLVPPSSVVGY
jgi:SAM-dependent methyltransferase